MAEVQDAWIMDIFKRGYRLAFARRLPQYFSVDTQSPICPKKRQCLLAYVKELITAQAVLPVPKHKWEKLVYSPLFLVAKSSGGFKLILDLKALNSFMKILPFRMESLQTIISVVKKGTGWLWSIWQMPMYTCP